MRKLQPVSTHPVPDAAARRAEKKRFLGETLARQADGSPWLVQAVLGGAPPLEITRDGVIPWRFNGVLPLRHGFSRTGAPATCLLAAPGVGRLKADAGERTVEVECAACRAWQATHRAEARRAPHGSVMARLRAAFGTGSRAA